MAITDLPHALSKAGILVRHMALTPNPDHMAGMTYIIAATHQEARRWASEEAKTLGTARRVKIVASVIDILGVSFTWDDEIAILDSAETRRDWPQLRHQIMTRS